LLDVRCHNINFIQQAAELKQIWHVEHKHHVTYMNYATYIATLYTVSQRIHCFSKYSYSTL